MLHQELRSQFERAKAARWLPTFDLVATKFGFDPSILIGIASRETNMHNIKGDNGHGHGVMQIDDRSFPAWCSSGNWKDPHASIKKGGWVLAVKVRDALAHQVPKNDSLRVGIAAYNAGGPLAREGYYKHGDPDRYTTGHNYSSDVLNRASIFKKLLEGGT